MARLLFEMQAVRTRRGPLAAGTEFVVYTDSAGTALADISATVGGSAIAGSTVTVADIPGLGPSALQFYGPPDDTDVLYLRCPSDASLGVQEIEADAISGGGGGDVAAHSADTTAVHGIANTASLALEPATNDQVRYVSTAGSDSNDGLSWGAAKLTVQAAHDSLPTHGGTIYIGKGQFTEDYVCSKNNVRHVGQGLLPDGTYIKATGNAATAITVAAHFCTFEHMSTLGFSTSFTGVGWDIQGAQHRLRACSHRNPDNTATSTLGGTGLKLQNVEGAIIEFAFGECNLGIHLVDQANENVFPTLLGASSYNELLIEGVCGANLFNHVKFTQGKTNTLDTQVVIGGGGANVFLAPDWSETGTLSRTVVSSNHNIFLNGTSSPWTTMTVSGDHNLLDGWRVLETLNVTGANNVLRKPHLNGTSIVNSGAGTVIDSPHVEAGSITYGNAVAHATRATGAALATTATDGFLYIPTCAGTPTGTPTAETGVVPLIFDTTNAKLYVFSGGSWKGGTAPGVFS